MEQNRIDRIRARARALWEARGRPQGQALDDWLAAEREIDGPTLADAGEEDPLAGVDLALRLGGKHIEVENARAASEHRHRPDRAARERQRPPAWYVASRAAALPRRCSCPRPTAPAP